jgi:uncharacterized protein HemX
MSMENLISDDPMPDEAAPESTDTESANAENPSVPQEKSMFEEHKGKLAIGVAATLGVMIFYNWLEKQLAKDDPESHARLQRLKAFVRAREAGLAQDAKGDIEDDPANIDTDTGEGVDDVIPSQVMNCKGPDGVSAAR